MEEEILADQRELVALLEDAGWDVTDVEVSVYESPFTDDETPEAEITLSARKQYPELGPDEDGGPGDGNDPDDNPFRLK